MTTLSYDYVYALGRSVGLTKSQAVLATAIAAAESGLNPKNIGDQTLAKYGSRGLWQIFTKVHPPSEVIPGSSASAWSTMLIGQLEDPKTNAHAMWLISGHGKNWGPWSTFNHGSHKQYLPKAQAAADRVGENWAAVLGGVTPPPVPPPVPGATYVVTLGKNVKPGKADPTTKDLQRALIAAGFAGFTKPNLLGYYGQGTQDAVRRFFDRYPQFQSSAKDTAIGPKGWAFLRDLALKGKS